ncbi:MAG TPA: MlaD family protein [Burkholderiales bacterium]|nr:MlaD family protein [Burkholderiales bacterium]
MQVKENAMQEDYSRPRRFKGIGRKVSLFFVTAVLGVIGIALLVSYKQGAFVRHTGIHFYAADAFGINKGTAVRLFGLPVGDVSSLDISDRGVKVQLSIISEYIPRLPKGSQARLVREGYVGAATIQIVPAAASGRAAEPVAEGDEIGYLPARGMAELVDEFKTQLTPVINDLRRMIAEMNRPDGDFRKSVAGASTVFQQLPETNREMRQVLQNADRTVVALGRQAEASLGSVGRVGAQIEKELPALTEKLGTTLDALSETSEQIRDAARKNGDALHEVLVQMPGLLRDGGDLVRDGQDVVGAARNSWLFRDMFEAKSVRTLPVDSFESAGQGRTAEQAPR